MLATPPATPLSSPDKGLDSPGSWPASRAWTAAPLKTSGTTAAAPAVSAEGATHDAQSLDRQAAAGDVDAAAVQLQMSENRAGVLVHQ
jgi:hypothetical protein